MATISGKSPAMLWAIAFAMIFASSTEAAKAPSPQQCWGSFTQIGGCAAEVSRAAASMQPSMRIGPDCCKAIVQLDNDCWSLMFPTNPGVSSLLKGICGSVMAAQRPAALSIGMDINATVLKGDVPDGAVPGPHN